MQKVVIITGNELRHQYYVSRIAEKLNVVGIVFEKKINQAKKFEDKPQELDIAARHFQNREVSEQYHFADKILLPDCPVMEVETGHSNSEETFQWVKHCQPDYILLFGCSIIKPPLLSHYDGKIINLHLGLSPYYRGAGTNFWPLVNGEPECVGGTIHLATLKVDAGDILYQVRPQISAGDNPHDIGNKTIAAAVAQIPAIVEAYHAGLMQAQKQNLSGGKVYRRKDLTTAAIEQLYQNFENGLVEDFLNNREQRLRAYPIIEKA
ncbi:MAG: formyl transferase [Bacteroidia bacterium]